MPRSDGTGPMGQGPRTGRGMGNCPGTGGFGRGFGRGMGRGFGMGRMFGFGGYSYQQPTKKEELDAISEDEKYLEEELKALRDYKKSLQK